MTGALAGKSIIVTGAGGGIGHAASLVLAAAGANVVVTDIAEEAGRATVDAIRSSNDTSGSEPAGATQAVPDRQCHRTQALIAGKVAETIVISFEMIDIDHDDRHWLT